MHLEDIAKNLPALLGALLVSILFIQSGLDKVFDWKGNVEWLKGHFSKTFLAGLVPLMLAKITIIELTAGLTSAAGIVYFLVAGSTALDLLGSGDWCGRRSSLVLRPENCQRLSRCGGPDSLFCSADDIDGFDKPLLKALAVFSDRSGMPGCHARVFCIRTSSCEANVEFSTEMAAPKLILLGLDLNSGRFFEEVLRF